MDWKPRAPRGREEKVAARLRASSRFYRFLWEIREELFEDGFEQVLQESYEPRGQEPCPPAMLAMVMLLQRYEGLSDARAVDAAENDRRWQLVLGTLGQDESPFGQGSLVRFRMRMLSNDLDKKLVDRTVELARKTKRFGWKKLRASLDSSPLKGAGRVEDTWNLIGRAMSKVVHAVSMALDIDETVIVEGAKLSVLTADSIKSALDIDWDNEDAQQAALERLLDQVSRLETWVAKRAGDESSRPPLQGALELMRRIVDQDTEPDPGGGRRIKDGVAYDRVISVGDPEMRHGRKSKTKRFNGYKRHIAVTNGFIVGTAVEPANVRECEPTPRLLESIAKQGRIDTLDIDRGYLPSPAVHKLHDEGITINSRPWKSRRRGMYPKEDFRIDLRRKLVTCPANKTAKIFPRGAAWFDVKDCGRCKLKKGCTTAARRTITIHPQEHLLIELRRGKRTRTGRDELRKRVGVEHRLARIGWIQGSNARYAGARKNELDLNRAAAIANLQQIALIRQAA